MPNSKLLIADEIKSQKLLIGVCRFLMLGLTPGAREPILAANYMETIPGYENVFPLYKKKLEPDFGERGLIENGNVYLFKSTEIFKHVDENPHILIEFLNIPIANAIVKIGDLLKDFSYFEKTAELEFFRHLRNAVAHGNKFNFMRNEPARPAVFKNFHLTSADSGKYILFTSGQESFIEQGDIIDLFDHLEAYLRNL